jgi:hypothetical protein
VNAAAKDVADPVVTMLTITQGGIETERLLPTRPVAVNIELGPKGIASAVYIEYFVDDPHSEGEETQTEQMFEDRQNGVYFYQVPRNDFSFVVFGIRLNPVVLIQIC